MIESRALGDGGEEIFRVRKCQSCKRTRKSYEITEEKYRELRGVEQRLATMRSAMESGTLKAKPNPDDKE